MKKKKILFVNCTMELGGVEKSLCDILQHLDKDKYELYLYLDSISGQLMSQIPEHIEIIQPNMDEITGPIKHVMLHELKKAHFPQIYLRLCRTLSSKYNYKFLELLKILYCRRKYDTVIAYREGAITQLAYRAFRWKRFVTWWHYGEVSQVPTSDLKYDKLTNISDFVGVSQGICRELGEVYSSLRDKIRYIPNMIDTQKIIMRSFEFTPTYDKKILNIITVGRLSPEKHIDSAITCGQLLREKNICFKWRILGDGSQYTLLEEKIRKNHLEHFFSLEGSQPNPYPYIRNSDLYVHPSYVESQGIVILEAMALGVPCVVTKSLGPCEFIQNGVNGILTEQSPESLFEKVLEMIQNQGLYQKIKSNTRCPEQFQAESVIKKIEALIEGENT